MTEPGFVLYPTSLGNGNAFKFLLCHPPLAHVSRVWWEEISVRTRAIHSSFEVGELDVAISRCRVFIAYFLVDAAVWL